MTSKETTDLVSEYSPEPIKIEDLHKLAEIALDELARLYANREETGRLYRDRLLLLCLCQGGAEHFVRGKHGVKDFDIWAFYEHSERPFPYRSRWCRDFGPSRFGRRLEDEECGYQGRRIDILGRSIPCTPGQDPGECVRRWLKSGAKESTPWHLVQRPVVVISPKKECGSVIWDPVNPDKYS